MTITVKTASTFARGGLGTRSGGTTDDESGAIVGLDSTGRLLVHGKIGSGTTDDTTHRELERYDPSTNAWTTLAASISYQLGHGWIIDSSDRIIYASGKIPSGSVYADTAIGEIYDPVANTWTAIASIPAGASAAARHYPYFFKDGSGLLNIMGGLAAPQPTNGWVYSGGSGGSWTEVTGVQSGSVPRSQRDANQDVPYDGAGVPWQVEPGRGQGAGAANLVSKWNGAGFTDLASRPAGNTKGYSSTPAVWATNGFLYVAGGINSGVAMQTSVWRYDPGANAWTQLASLPRAVAHASLVEFGGYLYLVGGRGAGPTYSAITFITRYDGVTNTWTDTADVLSVARAKLAVIRDLAGAGFWVYGGTTSDWGNNGGYTNVLEYWIPEPPTPSGLGQSWVGIIG